MSQPPVAHPKCGSKHALARPPLVALVIFHDCEESLHEPRVAAAAFGSATDT